MDKDFLRLMESKARDARAKMKIAQSNSEYKSSDISFKNDVSFFMGRFYAFFDVCTLLGSDLSRDDYDKQIKEDGVPVPMKLD